MSFPPEPQAGLPQAGWYPDPELEATVRYWDGASWSEHRAPAPAERKSDDTLIWIGWVCAVLFSLVGLIIGIVLAARGERQGIWIVALSLVLMVLGAVIAVS